MDGELWRVDSGTELAARTACRGLNIGDDCGTVQREADGWDRVSWDGEYCGVTPSVEGDGVMVWVKSCEGRLQDQEPLHESLPLAPQSRNIVVVKWHRMNAARAVGPGKVWRGGRKVTLGLNTSG